MPELPEVETIKNGIKPFTQHHKIVKAYHSGMKMRYPFNSESLHSLEHNTIIDLVRRGKHIIIMLQSPTQQAHHLIIHLGMSGTIQVKDKCYTPQKHDHFILTTSTHKIVFNDPRRFGYVIHTSDDPYTHPCIASHGIEPLTDTFNADYLYQHTQKTHRNIKQVIMDNHIVVGIGNIYASESLYRARIHPLSIAKNIPKDKIATLVTACKSILDNAIAQGGTTLKDYRNSQGKPGYFSQDLKVYGRAKQSCGCGNAVTNTVIAQRNTFFCERCQKKY